MFTAGGDGYRYGFSRRMVSEGETERGKVVYGNAEGIMGAVVDFEDEESWQRVMVCAKSCCDGEWKRFYGSLGRREMYVGDFKNGTCVGRLDGGYFISVGCHLLSLL